MDILKKVVHKLFDVSYNRKQLIYYAITAKSKVIALLL